MHGEDWREGGAVAAGGPATAQGREGGEAGSAAHYKKMYDRISTLAKIGVWECELADERLTWTDTVYDLFDIERGAPPVRAETAALYAPESRLRMERLRAAAIASGTGFAADFQIRTAAGNERWIRLTVEVEQEDGRSVRIFGTKQDITAERAAQDRLEALRAELTHLSRLNAMGTMASTIAHELNQPLAAIGNYMSSARRIAARGEVAPELSRCIDSVGALALRAGEIIRRLRDMTLRGRAPRTAFEIGTAAREAAELVTPRYPGAVVRFRTGPAAVVADRLQIQQVLINLIENSCEAAGEGPCEIEIGTAADGEWLEVSVADSGPGIDAALLPDVFETFLTTKPQDVGIGLAVSRTIVEAHGGRIRAANDPAGGARISFRLPVAEARAATGA